MLLSSVLSLFRVGGTIFAAAMHERHHPSGVLCGSN